MYVYMYVFFLYAKQMYWYLYSHFLFMYVWLTHFNVKARSTMTNLYNICYETCSGHTLKLVSNMLLHVVQKGVRVFESLYIFNWKGYWCFDCNHELYTQSGEDIESTMFLTVYKTFAIPYVPFVMVMLNFCLSVYFLNLTCRVFLQ